MAHYVADQPVNSLSVSVLILAAGASSRFGGQAKQLLRVGGQTLIRRIAETALAAQLTGPVAVVLGANRAAIAPELVDLPVLLIDNPGWAGGMSTSLRAGLTVLMQQPDGPDAVVVLLCDQPLVTPELVRQLLATCVQTGKPMVACRYRGGVGVPALFTRSVFADLLALDGDKGARHLLQNRETDRAEVYFEPAALDLDTWQDVAQWSGL